MASLSRTTLRFLSSYALSCILFVLLLVLTYLGTLYQTEYGLYAAQERYFSSFFVVHHLFGALPLPLPGGSLLLALLFVNLLMGGLICARKGWSYLGVLMAHAGILLLLVGCFVTFRYAVSGDLMLYEGDRSATVQSENEWELAVAEADSDGPVSEFVIYQDEFEDATSDSGIAFELPNMPVTLRVSQYVANAVVRKAGDGSVLAVSKGSESAPGARISLLESGQETSAGIAWGRARKALTLEGGGKRWSIEMRNREWQLPFEVQLDKFTRELYPGTQIPKVFRSDITKYVGEVTQNVAITMNEPLREKGYTLYQSSWGPQNARPGEPLYSVLAVVSNPAEQIPLYSCLVITLGLLIHFGQKLLRYLQRESAGKAAVTLLVLISLLTGDALAQSNTPEKNTWDAASLKLLATLPVQEGGRIKPLETYANVTLLRLNGKRSAATVDGRSLTSIEWLADCLFYPESAKQYKTFQINNADVAVALQIPFEKKRDRCAYVDLAPARDRLFELAREYSELPEQQRNTVQGQIINLAHNLIEFEQLCNAMAFARTPVEVAPGTPLSALFPDTPNPPLSAVLNKVADIRDLIIQARKGSDDSANEVSAYLKKLQANVEDATLRLIPPASGTEWLSPQSLTHAAFGSDEVQTGAISVLAQLEALALDPTDAALASFHAEVTTLAAGRGEYKNIKLEVIFSHLQLFYYSLIFFILGFIVVTVAWLAPNSKFLYRSGFLMVLVSLILLTAGITIRSIIRGRPPVTTLYETILFATWIAVGMAVFMEWANRRRIMLSLAAILGVFGMFVANKYEVSEGVDTMPSMVAVLDSNFWLATHVTTITIGYGAAFLASALAHLYVFGRAFRIKASDHSFYHHLARMTYGVLCFSLLFTILGTVLGGIWANESWGRFWGWDPKENGALMIVLWQLAVLHGRLGGYVRDFGMALASIFMGVIVAFSWLGVNLLGVGLHSYGFTNGTYKVLLIFYVVEACVLLLGAAAWTWEEKTGIGVRTQKDSTRI